MIGGYHAKILRGLGCDVTTVDPDPSKGADYRSLHAAFTAMPNPSVAVVAVPVPQALEAASWFEDFAGHLLLEKPFAASTDDAEVIMGLLSGVEHVGVGYVERFNPVVRQMRAQLATETPKRVLFERWNDRASWDTSLDLASHDHDLARLMGVDHIAEYSTKANAGCRIRRITAWGDDPIPRIWDLMFHNGNPLREQWKSFLADKGEVATMQDAAAVIASLERTIPQP